MTTKELLTTLKTFLQDKSKEGLSDNLAKIKQFKKGVLSPMPIFPAVVIVPRSERLEKFYSGGMYHAGREIEIYVYVKGIGKQKEDRLQCMQTIGEIRSLLYENHTLGKSEIYNIEFGEEDYFGDVPFGRLILQEGKFSMTFWSKENLPTDRTESIALSISDVKDLLDSITEKFKKAKNDGSLDVKQMVDVSFPPIPKFPAVGVTELPSSTEHFEAGRDTHFRNFTVFVWSKCFDKEIVLDVNLDLIEQVKELIWRNYKWAGKTRNTIIRTINYEMVTEANILLYQSQVSFECQAVSLVPQ